MVAVDLCAPSRYLLARLLTAHGVRPPLLSIVATRLMPGELIFWRADTGAEVKRLKASCRGHDVLKRSPGMNG